MELHSNALQNEKYRQFYIGRDVTRPTIAIDKIELSSLLKVSPSEQIRQDQRNARPDTFSPRQVELGGSDP
jgi:hypothetical protein